MKLVTVRYLGFTAMDRRFSNAMIPWIVSEIRKRDSKEQVSLGAEDGTLQAYNVDFELQFSHRIQDISRFCQADADHCEFLYLVRDDNDKLLYCYMFQALSPQDVSDLYLQMREQGASGPTLTSLCGDISPSSSHFFEVLYVGKIRVSHRRVPETFIDDALEKFKSHEIARRASYDSTASSDSYSTIDGSSAQSDESVSQPPPQIHTEVIKKYEKHDHNRTMVLQVGRSDLRLISPDRKQVLLHKYHKDVLTCVQGSSSPEHFGFVCKEHQTTQQQQAQQQATYVGYIFKCESSSVSIDAVGAVSQAAAAPTCRSPSLSVVTCEHCPMVWYHRLCADVEGLGERKTQATIFRRIEQLDEEEQQSVLTKFRGAETDSLKDQNEFLMMLLRAHCEMKQNRHVHDTAEQRSEFLSHYLGGATHNSGAPSTGTIFMKAKRSLSISFEHLLKRKGSRDDIGMHLPRDLSLPIVGPMSVREGSSSPTTPTPGCDFPEYEGRRSRSGTIGSQKDFQATLSPERNGGPDKNPKSPMMEIFMKVGNSPRNTSDESPKRNDTPGSWRQAIFNRVVTPNKNASPQQKSSEEKKPHEKRTSEELRALWRRSIRQAVLLVRMEKENARLRARQEVSAMKRVKLEYDEMGGDRGRDSLELWDVLAAGKSDRNVVLRAAGRGVPAARRGDVWQRLTDLYCSSRPPFDTKEFPNYDVPYEQLLKQLTAHQHAILIDLGRTFPNHPYYRSPLGPGQLSLFNLLKAYSLLDPEVGYCQGLSFVTGVLLLHMDEADAFAALRHLMFRRGLRAHYLPDMAALQVRLYQLSRLLHDRLPELYAHLDAHEVSPTLYAAPWLLTLFASQFPLGFVARVFDVIFVEGEDVVFRVALALLAYHAEALLACESFEQIMDYLKCRLPDVDAPLLDKIMCKALGASSDIAVRLNEYKVEYQVLQEEAHSAKPHMEELHRLRNENRALMDRNMALTAQLEISLSNVQRLERNRTLTQSGINRLEVQARTLEVSVITLGTFIDSLVENRVDIEIPGEVRRIVGQLMVNERRKNDQRPAGSNALIKTISNSTQLFKRIETQTGQMKPPPPALVKSLSMGRLGLNTPSNNNETPRTLSLQSSSDMERNLRNDLILSERGCPLRVIEDTLSDLSDHSRHHPLKTTLSNPNLSSKVSNFFSNTHNHILRSHRASGSPPPSPPRHIIREESREDMSPVEEHVSLKESICLPLERTTDVVSPSDSIDSGMGTPLVSPPGVETPGGGGAGHPLSGCDVNFTFNGTSKLKNIKNLRNFSRNSSPDLLGK